MFKHTALVLFACCIALACAEPKPAIVAPLAYTAGPAAAIYSQEYHGNFAAPYVAAAAPYVASPYVASPYVASPYVAGAPYVASPYAAAAYSAPLLLKK